MKVCTDACLFGAWVGALLGDRGQVAGDRRVLDIGAGTGLLSLLLAQKTAGQIDAIEIDVDAAEQAAANFEASPWKERLTLLHKDVTEFAPAKKYELIISNPPFFENDLESPDDKRNLALHSSALHLAELIGVIKKHLTDGGQFAVLLPYHRNETFKNLATGEGFYLHKEANVRQTPKHPFFRSMLLFGRSAGAVQLSEITIRDGDAYSAAFSDLLKDYYLNV